MAEPQRGVAYSFDIQLTSGGAFVVDPAIATGDFTVSTDNGAFSNLTTLPTVSPSGSINVSVNVSDSEMDGDKIVIYASSQTSAWDDVTATIETTTQTVDTIFDTTIEAGFSAAEVMRINTAALAGLADGLDTTNVTFTGIDNTTTRITAVVDTYGNRRSITLNGN